MVAEPGTRVTAKRLGWDERLDAEQEFDMEPYAEHGYASDDLVGTLETVEADGLVVYLVDGQEADPGTVQAVEPVEEKGLVFDSVQAAGKWLAQQWDKLESRYGRKQALAMAAAMLATSPLPGNIPAIVAVAEGIRGLSGYFSKECGGVVPAVAKAGPKSRLPRR